MFTSERSSVKALLWGTKSSGNGSDDQAVLGGEPNNPYHHAIQKLLFQS